MPHTLQVNAHLKYVEFLLHVFDNYEDDVTLSSIRDEFKQKFKNDNPLLNQYFGIYRLVPLLLTKEEYKNKKAKLEGDIAKIKIIRDAIAHNNFSIDESGYFFSDSKQSVAFSYEEFLKFLHKIENEFYSNFSFQNNH